jgi:hypothetical protein
MSRSTVLAMLWSWWTRCMRTQKNLKLEVSPDDTTLTLQDIVSRRVQWRRSIDVDPATTLVSITPSHSLTTLASILPKPQPELPILDQLFLSPPQTQSTPLHLITHSLLLLQKSRQRLYVPRVNQSGCCPRRKRASNHCSRQL